MKTQVSAEVTMTPSGSITWLKSPWERGGDLLIDPTLDPALASEVVYTLTDYQIAPPKEPIGRGGHGEIYKIGSLAIKNIWERPAKYRGPSHITDLQAGITFAEIINKISPALGKELPILKACMPLAAVINKQADTMVFAMPYIDGKQLSYDDTDGKEVSIAATKTMGQILRQHKLREHIFLDPGNRNLLRTGDTLVKIDTVAHESFAYIMEPA